MTTTIDEPRSLLSYEQAAVRLGASRDFVRALGRRGEITVVRLTPRCSRVVADSIDAYIARRMQRPA